MKCWQEGYFKTFLLKYPFLNGCLDVCGTYFWATYYVARQELIAFPAKLSPFLMQWSSVDFVKQTQARMKLTQEIKIIITRTALPSCKAIDVGNVNIRDIVRSGTKHKAVKNQMLILPT